MVLGIHAGNVPGENRVAVLGLRDGQGGHMRIIKDGQRGHILWCHFNE